MTGPRERLLQLIGDLAVVRGRVTLSSGAEADYYVDLRRVTLHGEAAPWSARCCSTCSTPPASAPWRRSGA